MTAGAFLPGRVVRLHPATRRATVALKPVGRGQSYAGAFAPAAGRLALVTGLGTSRQLGRLVTVRPTAGGAELDLIVGDDDAWAALAVGAARVDVQVAFEGSRGGDPVGGRPVRVEIG